MSDRPLNVVVMLSDELRADCIGCYGNPMVQTPHIDTLASQGTRFSHAFCQHPQCAPSRASILTGRYPHVNGAISNYTAVGEHEITLGEYFQSAGYRSIGVGKLHLYDHKKQAGFTDTQLTEGQHSAATDPECLHEDYKRWLKENSYWEDAKKAYAIHGTDAYWDNFQANVNPMPKEAYIDTWVGDRAVEYIQNQPEEDPFFMFIGFPNPHIPFDAPEPYASMYNPADVPLPPTFNLDLSNKPPHQLAYKQKGRRVNYEHLDEPRLRQVIALYYASITLVDDQVGKVVRALKARNFWDNTLVVFLSDHGEFLGHYGMLIKSMDEYPILYDVGLHVPLIVRTPNGAENHVINDLVELVDLCPTVLDSAGLEVAPELQGHSQHQALQGGPAYKRKYIFAESGAVKTIRSQTHKLVYYPGQPYGELYDLEQDPNEMQNLYQDPNHRDLRNR
ncbi:MAG: sulfatase-like hydrolase/transferase [bacterium]|nr:sulfatase-like hydrolase/transferase [bacterium]